MKSVRWTEAPAWVLSIYANAGLHVCRNCEALVAYEEQYQFELTFYKHAFHESLFSKRFFCRNAVKPWCVDDNCCVANSGLVFEEVTTTNKSQSGVEKKGRNDRW